MRLQLRTSELRYNTAACMIARPPRAVYRRTQTQSRMKLAVLCLRAAPFNVDLECTYGTVFKFTRDK